MVIIRNGFVNFQQKRRNYFYLICRVFIKNELKTRRKGGIINIIIVKLKRGVTNGVLF